MSNKAELREHFLQLRDGIDESDRQQAATNAAKFVVEHPMFASSTHIACYCAHKNEFETIPVIHAIWNAGKKCYLPILAEGKVLSFVQYEQGDKLEINQVGILEPFNFSKKINPEKLDMVIMPLVAYDSHGRRLGTGGGYYDRTFAFTHANTHHIHFAGLAFTTQHTDHLPTDPWDISLHSVITEQGVRSF